MQSIQHTKYDGFKTLSKCFTDTGTKHVFSKWFVEHLIMLQYTPEKCVMPKE